MVRVAKIPAHLKSTIQIELQTRTALAERGRDHESYDDILERLITQYETKKRVIDPNEYRTTTVHVIPKDKK